MSEKQLEFRFMHNKILRVTALGYLERQDEDLRGYHESLIIEYLGGMNQYVLHAMEQSREDKSGNEKIVNNHRKLVFPSKSRLLQAWKNIYQIINNELLWEKTNLVCGTDSSPEEFYKIKRRKL